MRRAMMKGLYAVTLSLLIVGAAGTVGYCDVVGKWNVASSQAAYTRIPGQAWETTAFDVSQYMEFGADGAYSESRGAVGTWSAIGPYANGGVRFSVDIRDFLPILWSQILQSKGMEGTFELTSYAFTGIQNRWHIQSRLLYRGIAHVTSPVVMDVKVKADAKFSGIPAVPAQ